MSKIVLFPQTIGQAYDDMQNQNQQLLQQITERDDYNIKVSLISWLWTEKGATDLKILCFC